MNLTKLQRKLTLNLIYSNIYLRKIKPGFCQPAKLYPVNIHCHYGSAVSQSSFRCCKMLAHSCGDKAPRKMCLSVLTVKKIKLDLLKYVIYKKIVYHVGNIKEDWSSTFVRITWMYSRHLQSDVDRQPQSALH